MHGFTVAALLVAALLIACCLSPTQTRAADLSGHYAGFDRAEGLTLRVDQVGALLSGEMVGPDWRLEFSGTNDGSNMANVGVTLVAAQQQRGFMIMRRQPGGMQLSLVIKQNRDVSGQYHFRFINDDKTSK